MNVASHNHKKKIGCALCVACDLPAGRKTCAFLGHSAHLGCSRCLKKFTGTVGSMDYAGFDRKNWTLRTGVQHSCAAHKLLNCKTKAEFMSLESEKGCRYSEVLKLPYFDQQWPYIGTSQQEFKQ